MQRFYLVMWFLWVPLRGVLVRLPLRCTRVSARFAGAVSHLLSRGSRREMEEEFRTLLPEAALDEIQRWVKASVQNWYMGEFDNMVQTRMASWDAYREAIRNKDRLDAALDRGKGVLLVIVHFGAFLQVLPALAHNGYTVNQIANRLPPLGEFGGLRGYFRRKRFEAQDRYCGQHMCVTFLETGNFMREVFRKLEANEVVVVAIDGKTERESPFYPFLASEAYPMSDGPIGLAVKTGAAVVPAYMVRGGDGHNVLEIEEEIPIETQRDTAESVRDATLAFLRTLERQVHDHPEHYGTQLLLKRRDMRELRDGGPSRAA